MKTINQLLDLALELPGPRSKKLNRIIKKLKVLKLTDGGQTFIENTEAVLRVIEKEEDKLKFNTIEK